MTPMNERWALRETDAEASLRLVESLAIPKPMADVLVSRGIKNPKEAYFFLQPSVCLLHSPFLMRDMEKAVERFRIAIEKKEIIAVFSDSDLDGLTSLTALLALIQRIAPDIQVHFRYPRGNEYYGLTRDAIDEFHEKHATLLITLDCGTKDVEEIAYAAQKGMDTIVIDHHEAEGELPCALILNPKRKDCPYPFKELAGVGVVFKFCHAVLLSYLPGFSKKFLIVSQSEKTCKAAKVVNGIVEWTGTCTGTEEIEALVHKADYVMGYRCGENFNKTGMRYLDIEEELKLIQASDTNRGDSNSDIVLSNYEAVDLFMELQYYRSPKIVEFNNYILGLVALGAIADIVPLIEENRVMVHLGLESLKNTSHAGLSLLLNNKKVSSRTLGWHVAPVLNAPGRMGRTEYTADFLLGTGGREHGDILEEILGLNKKRREMVDCEVNKIFEMITNGNIDTSRDVVFVRADLPEGVIGLIANRVSEMVKKPVIVVSRTDENGIVKGSGRVRGDFDFFSKISGLSIPFEKVGGHAQAFGFTIKEELLDGVVAQIARSVSVSNFTSPVDPVDCVLDIRDVTIEVAEKLELLEPTGKGNEEPVFLTRGAVLRKFVRIGVGNQHGKYLFKDNLEAEAVGWNIGDYMEQHASAGAVDIVYRLEVGNFNGRRYPQMVILDIVSGV